MALLRRDGVNKRAFNFLVGFFLLAGGYAMIEDGTETGLGLVLFATGGLAILAAFFPAWTRVR